MEQLIDTFAGNSSMLVLKFNNLIKPRAEDANEVRFVIECLLLRALRSKNGISECSLLVNLQNNELFPTIARIIDELLFELFNSAEGFELSLLVSYAKLFSFVVSNSK